MKPSDMASGWVTGYRAKAIGRTQSKMVEKQRYNRGDITKESEEIQIEALKRAYEG